MPLSPYAFGEKIARQTKRAWGGAAGFSAGSMRPPPADPKPEVPSQAFDRPTGQLLSDMSNNSARVSGGILSTAAGAVGTLATAPFAGLTNAWNAITPKSMNTSDEWSAGVNSAFNSSLELAGNGARDVYGGLGGDTNYDTQTAWKQMERGFNDPTVDQTTRNVANAAGWTGHGAFNAATIAANPGKILGSASGLAAKAPGMAKALGTAGKVVNRIDDFGATPTEMANAANRSITGIQEGIPQNQQPDMSMQANINY